MSLGLIQLAVTGTVSGLANNQAANTALEALATLLAGGTAPTAVNTGLSSVAGVPWRDTSVTPNVLRLRNDADTAFLALLMIDQAAGVSAPYLGGVNPQTGTSYALAATDLGKLVTFTNASAIAVSIVQATTAGFTKGAWWAVKCLSGSTGSVTITPTTSTIDGGASLVVRPGFSAIIWSDGANYFSICIPPGMVGDSGSGGRTGLVPAPASGDAAAAKFLKADGTWAVPAGTAQEETGVIKMWPTGTAPSGYLLCDGSAVSRTTYAALFAVISTTFGAGDGSTTFNLPPFSGRMPVGVDAGAVRIAGAASIGATGGSQYLQNHAHSGASISLTTGANSNPGAAYNGGTGNTPAGDGHTHSVSGTTGNTGNPTSATVSQMNPFLAINFIIKT